MSHEFTSIEDAERTLYRGRSSRWDRAVREVNLYPYVEKVLRTHGAFELATPQLHHGPQGFIVDAVRLTQGTRLVRAGRNGRNVGLKDATYAEDKEIHLISTPLRDESYLLRARRFIGAGEPRSLITVREGEVAMHGVPEITDEHLEAALFAVDYIDRRLPAHDRLPVFPRVEAASLESLGYDADMTQVRLVSQIRQVNFAQ